MEHTPSRREELADVAIDVLAEAGMRGLTHRAVDRAAGVPEGSCSYYFRTRQALLQAAVDRLEQVDAAELDDAPARTVEEVADRLAGLVEHWTTAGRQRMLARYELALEATRRPELRTVLVGAGARSRAVAEATLAAIGVAEPARRAPLLVSYIDGLIFEHLAGAGDLSLSHSVLREGFLDYLGALPLMSGWRGSFIACHVLLVREDGWVAFLRRSGTGYRDGWLNPPAGRVEPGEDVRAAAVREAAEEVGITLDPAAAEFVHVMHRTEPSLPGPCHAISDYWFRFRPGTWTGEPRRAEPDRASEVVWFDPDAPPPDVIPHCALALAAIQRGERFSVHGWTN